jgi:thiamine pyrophosphate-dependent acetolactate synthase large subunit-like protein
MYTASSIFFKTLSEVGITHVFVNWGSDHPGMLEELAERSQDGIYDGMKIVTCPNEMAGLSAAQGYVQVTGKPAAVIVHVDVGTQVCTALVLSSIVVSNWLRHWHKPFIIWIEAIRLF